MPSESAASGGPIQGYCGDCDRPTNTLPCPHCLGSWPCSRCGGATVYQTFSGGREWYCEACDMTGEYPDDEPGLPRATLLRTPEGVVALRAQMDQELARRRDADRD